MWGTVRPLRPERSGRRGHLGRGRTAILGRCRTIAPGMAGCLVRRGPRRSPRRTGAPRTAPATTIRSPTEAFMGTPVCVGRSDVRRRARSSVLPVFVTVGRDERRATHADLRPVRGARSGSPLRVVPGTMCGLPERCDASNWYRRTTMRCLSSAPLRVSRYCASIGRRKVSHTVAGAHAEPGVRRNRYGCRAHPAEDVTGLRAACW